MRKKRTDRTHPVSKKLFASCLAGSLCSFARYPGFALTHCPCSGWRPGLASRHTASQCDRARPGRFQSKNGGPVRLQTDRQTGRQARRRGNEPSKCEKNQQKKEREETERVNLFLSFQLIILLRHRTLPTWRVSFYSCRDVSVCVPV